MKKGKYLITGCAGFIGSNLIKKMNKKYDLILVDDLSEGSVNNIPKNLRKRLIRKKIQNIKKLYTNKIDGIFHLAAQSSVPQSLKDFYSSSSNNLKSTLKVFDLANHFSVPVVYASSSAIYGNLPVGNDKIEKFSITSPYAQDKLTIEHYAKMYFNIFKIPSVGLRLFNVYGPGQNPHSPYSAVIPIFINRMKRNLKIIINGGYQTRDFVYIDDIIKVMFLSMKKLQRQKSYYVMNVGTGKSININKLFNIIKKNLRVNPRVIKRKLDKFDPKKSSGKFDKLNRFLNIKNSKFVKLEDGITKTILAMKK